ncbi:MAG TPA: prepilin-type N-terminal cleavage/methylation domain-containing protein [Candidatus Binatia bacterium]|jgi:prepilin-type N-terminal cleavage/methylation domain-containing protein
MSARLACRRGFTLLELLVSIGIAAIVLTGLASAVASQSRSAILTLGTADMSQDARSAIDLFKRDVRMAGYNMGAVATATLAPIVVNANAAGEVYHITLRGNYQNVNSTGSAAAATSTITLDATAVPACGTLVFTAGKRLAIESQILGAAEVGTITAWNSGACTITLAAPLVQAYVAGSPVHQIDDVIYILTNTGVLRRNGDPVADGLTLSNALQVSYVLSDGSTTSDPSASLDVLRAATIRVIATGSNQSGTTPQADASTQVRIRNLGIATAALETP